MKCPSCGCIEFVYKNVFPKYPAKTYFHVVKTICAKCGKTVSTDSKL